MGQRGKHDNHPKGERHHAWNGGRYLDDYGYVHIWTPDNPRSDVRGYVKEHILVAAAALGKPLPPRAVVHHDNAHVSDNRAENLVICENQAYHRLLHRRARAYDACGHAGWPSCRWCGKHDAPENVVTWANGKSAHPDCERERSRKYKQAYKQRQRAAK